MQTLTEIYRNLPTLSHEQQRRVKLPWQEKIHRKGRGGERDREAYQRSDTAPPKRVKWCRPLGHYSVEGKWNPSTYPFNEGQVTVEPKDPTRSESGKEADKVFAIELPNRSY